MALFSSPTPTVTASASSEAMNSSEEEFGEKRIASVAVANHHLPLHELLWIIEKHVTDFHESSEFSDDFTLLAVRRRTGN